nr:hypothetical protein [Mesorhizobium sp. M4A.F.Ca.ET.050.02.1.1]
MTINALKALLFEHRERAIVQEGGHAPASLAGDGIGGGGPAADGSLDLDAIAVGKRDDILQHSLPAAMRDGVARFVAADPRNIEHLDRRAGDSGNGKCQFGATAGDRRSPRSACR